MTNPLQSIELAIAGAAWIAVLYALRPWQWLRWRSSVSLKRLSPGKSQARATRRLVQPLQPSGSLVSHGRVGVDTGMDR